MRYVFAVPGAERRVMHIERHNQLGEGTLQSLCGRGRQQPFNRTINAPFGLGRPVCKLCRRAASPGAAP